MNKRLVWISLIFLAIISVAMILFQGWIDHEKPQLKEVDVRKMIEQRYAGKVTQIRKVTDLYQIRFQNRTGVYQIDISAVNGQVSNLVHLKKMDTSPKERQTENQILAEKEAERIAMSQVDHGQVEEIELEEEAGILQYEIQIIDANQQEIEVYLNAYTGEILSIVKNEDDEDD